MRTFGPSALSDSEQKLLRVILVDRVSEVLWLEYPPLQLDEIRFKQSGGLGVPFLRFANRQLGRRNLFDGQMQPRHKRRPKLLHHKSGFKQMAGDIWPLSFPVLARILGQPLAVPAVWAGSGLWRKQSLAQ